MHSAAMSKDVQAARARFLSDHRIPNINDICSRIILDRGDMSMVFEDERLRPLLITHFAGFQAFSEHVRHK